MSASIKMAKMRTTGYGRGYAGDPGIFGFLKKAVTGIAKVGLGVASSLPGVGIVARGAQQMLFGRQPTAPAQPATPLPYQFAPGPLLQMGAVQQAMASVPRRQIGVAGTIPSAAAPGLQTPPPDASGRWRANKTGYYVQAVDGSPEQGGIWVPAESVWVRKRRRNPLNPRAYDRAISRVASAKRFGKKLGRVTIRSACQCR